MHCHVLVSIDVFICLLTIVLLYVAIIALVRFVVVIFTFSSMHRLPRDR